jgi:MoxR-like ATPase
MLPDTALAFQNGIPITMEIDGIPLTLTQPDPGHGEWIDYNEYHLQLQAAWLRLSDDEPPLNPRIVGEPGLGKTTLARAVGQSTGRRVYIFQCTMDTRPEDLVITPVLTGERQIAYRASAVATAVILGGVALLDEANRMPERSWASLASLMDERRSIKSEVTGLTLAAHPDFRICVTMNADSSVYELPGYIQSRLKPKIEIVPPPWDIRERIIRAKCPRVAPALLKQVLNLLRKRAERGLRDSARDMLTLAHYAQKLRDSGWKKPLDPARQHVLDKPDA